MPNINKTYNLNKIKQLIDLNENLTNFELSFSITSKTNDDFDVIILDQYTLDTIENIEYKKANGSISGQIKNDNNIFQNYYLILRSDKPNTVDVNVTINEIPPVIIDKHPDTIINNNLCTAGNYFDIKFDWKIIILVLLSIFIIWILFFDNTNSSKQSNNLYETKFNFNENVKQNENIIPLNNKVDNLENINTMNNNTIVNENINNKINDILTYY
jgi:hypothetical protein